jgi:hypothetical protein
MRNENYIEIPVTFAERYIMIFRWMVGTPPLDLHNKPVGRSQWHSGRRWAKVKAGKAVKK